MKHKLLPAVFFFRFLLTSSVQAQPATDSSATKSNKFIFYVFAGYPITVGVELDCRPSELFAVGGGIGDLGRKLYIGPQIRIIKARSPFDDIGFGMRYIYYDNRNTTYNGLMLSVGTMASSLRWYNVQFGSIFLSPTNSRDFNLSWFSPVVQVSIRLF